MTLYPSSMCCGLLCGMRCDAIHVQHYYLGFTILFVYAHCIRIYSRQRPDGTGTQFQYYISMLLRLCVVPGATTPHACSQCVPNPNTHCLHATCKYFGKVCTVPAPFPPSFPFIYISKLIFPHRS